MSSGRSESNRSVFELAIATALVVLVFIGLAFFVDYTARDIYGPWVVAGIYMALVLLVAVVVLTLRLGLGWETSSSFALGIGVLALVMALSLPALRIVNRIAMLLVAGVVLASGLLNHMYERSSERADEVGRRLKGLSPGILPENFSPPDWMGDGVEAVYLDSDGDREWLRIVPDKEGYLLKARSEPIDLKAGDKRSWMEWPLENWLRADYGWFFIDTTIDPSRQIVQDKIDDVPAQYCGIEEVVFDNMPYSCLRFKLDYEGSCYCVVYPAPSLHPPRPGSCSGCGGSPFSRRNCSRCGGTGICQDCKGTGLVSRKVHLWYEEKTGIKLREELRDEDGKVHWAVLESLKPNVMASG